jgi:transcription initiation factor IIE alpha subunit
MVAKAQRAPTQCPICEVDFEVDFACGNYIVFKCPKCGLNIREFGNEPLAAFYEGDDEKSVDIVELLDAYSDRHPPEIIIPSIDLSALGSDLG